MISISTFYEVSPLPLIRGDVNACIDRGDWRYLLEHVSTTVSTALFNYRRKSLRHAYRRSTSLKKGGVRLWGAMRLPQNAVITKQKVRHSCLNVVLFLFLISYCSKNRRFPRRLFRGVLTPRRNARSLSLRLRDRSRRTYIRSHGI